MRKVDDKEKKKEKKKIMTFIVATNIVASRPPERRTLVPIVHLSVFLICDLSFMHLLAPRSTCYSTYRNIML